MADITFVPQKNQRDYLDRILAGIAITTIIAAWFLGHLLNQSNPPNCLSVLSEAEICTPIGNNIIEGVIRNEDGTEIVVGWATSSEASGYAGPVSVLTGISPNGEILGVEVIDQTETPGFFALIETSSYLEDMLGKSADSPFALGEDLDAVSRATVSSKAISDAVRNASYTLAETKLGLSIEHVEKPIKFGLPEITLILLYGVGWVSHRGGFPYKKIARWATLLAGMIILGFIFNAPLTIAHFNSLFLGFFPDWQSNLYWYLLIGGIIFITAADGKNPYCSWFCPFGAAQECLGAIGGAKLLHRGKYRQLFSWLKRGLAWSAIVLALLLRNPGLSSYEIFGALFSFNAAGIQWIILIVILVLSLFIRRPWCNFLCPIDPIEEFILAQRRWTRQVIRKWQKQSKVIQP